jgi:hypothetical protein
MTRAEHAGIAISGGNVTIGALATGPHARASGQVTAPAAGHLTGDPGDSLPELLQQLLDALAQHADDIQDPAAAEGAARQLSAELDQGRRPDAARLARLLTALAAAAGPAAGIATAITSVLRAAGAVP